MNSELEAQRKAIVIANLLAKNGLHNRALLQETEEQMDDAAIEALIAMGQKDVPTIDQLPKLESVLQ